MANELVALSLYINLCILRERVNQVFLLLLFPSRFQIDRKKNLMF